MNTKFWLIQAFNGISYGALLFLVGSGLSLIFGVMRIVNLAHGSYFMLGGYVALTVIGRPAPGCWRSRSPRSPSPPSASRWSACSCARKVSNICATR